MEAIGSLIRQLTFTRVIQVQGMFEKEAPLHDIKYIEMTYR